jgi:hypothetical protein
VSGLAVFVWLVVVSLTVAYIVWGLAENNITYMLWGTFLAVVSAHFMVIIIAAAAARLVVKMVRRALRKEIEELCRKRGLNE